MSRTKFVAAVATILLLAIFQVAVQAKPAHAYEVHLSIQGAGTVDEDPALTQANILNPACSSSSTTPTGVIGAHCYPGDPSGDYGWGWTVQWKATPAPGYTFVRWESDGTPGTTAVICDKSTPPATTSTYTGTSCKFETYANYQTRAIFEDTTRPPTPTITSTNPSSTLVNGSKSFNFEITSDPTFKEFQCRVTPNVQTTFQSCNTGVSFNPSADDNYTFEVRAIDWSGQVSLTNATHSWTVDKTAPLPSITGPSGFSNSSSATFSFSSTEQTTYQCSRDGAAFSSCTGSNSQSYAGLADGPHFFDLRATDQAGNTSLTRRSWTIDTVAPNTTLDPNVGPTPDSATQNNDPVFAFTSSENDSTFECNLTGPGMTDTAFTACNTSPNTQITKSYTNLPDGTYTFKVRAKDRATNVDTDYSDSTRTWTIDTLPPAAPVINSPADNFLSNSNDITVSGTAEANSEVEIFDGGIAEDTTTANGSGNWSITLPDEAEGSHTYTAKATDGVGLTSGVSNARSVSVDTITPGGTITINNNNEITNNAAVNLALNATDPSPASGVTQMRFSNDGVTWSDWEDYATSFSWNLIGGDGTRTVRVQFRDDAGNISNPPATDTIKLDTTDPTALNWGPKRTGTTRSKPTVFFSEKMDKALVETTGTFILKKGTRTIGATVKYVETLTGQYKAILTPNRKLRSGVTYTASTTAGAKDLAGNALDQNPNLAGNQPKTWKFTVK